MLGFVIWWPGIVFCGLAYFVRSFRNKPIHVVLALLASAAVWVLEFAFASYVLIELGFGETWMRQLAGITIQITIVSTIFGRILAGRNVPLTGSTSVNAGTGVRLFRMVTGGIITILGFLLLLVVTDFETFKRGFEESYSGQSAASMATEIAAHAQQALPLHVNDVTTLLAVQSDDEKLVYMYTFSTEELTPAELEELREVAVYNACNGPNIRRAIDRGVRITSIYKTERTGRYLGTVKVGKEDCTG